MHINNMTNLMESQGGRVIIDLALRCWLEVDWIVRSGAEKGEVTAVTTFHCHCVHHPLAWKPNLVQYSTIHNINININKLS